MSHTTVTWRQLAHILGELRRISALLHPPKEVRKPPSAMTTRTGADASEEDEFDVFSMTANCSMTPPESHFCFDGEPHSAFAPFDELTRTNARMDAITCKPNERY
jgi:hypothetical protein